MPAKTNRPLGRSGIWVTIKPPTWAIASTISTPGIDGVRFRRPVVPGDQLVIRCELVSLKRKRFGKVKAEATVDGDLVCSGELMFSLVD